MTFLPFDPAVKRSEAEVRNADGSVARVVKGAFAVVQGLSQPSPACSAIMDELQAKGYRVLAVAAGPAAKLQMIGLIALSDPPREDSTALIAELAGLGVRTFLATGLIITGKSILTPMLVVLMMVTGDFLAISSSTDNVRPSPTPSVWKISRLTAAGVIMGAVDLLFCVACFSTGRVLLDLDIGTLQTLTVVTLVFSGQAVFYVARKRQHLWRFMPGKWLIVSSAVDLTLISFLAVNGLMMKPLAIAIVAGLFVAAIIFSLLLDSVKVILFRRFEIA
jgi:hypothetical protein